MNPRVKECVLYIHGTGHVQGLRARLRDRLDARGSVECERMLDAIIERAVEIALEPHEEQP